MFQHQIAQAFFQNMRIYLGRSDISVPQQGLDGAQIGAARQEEREIGAKFS